MACHVLHSIEGFFGCAALGFIEARDDEARTDLHERYKRMLQNELGYAHVKFQGACVIIGRDLPPRDGRCTICGADALPDDDLCARHRRIADAALLRAITNARH